MAIDQAELQRAAERAPLEVSSKPSYAQRTGFLCHSHKDKALARGLQQKLREDGLDLYIDWQDIGMPERPTTGIAQRLQTSIIGADLFLFLATANSTGSRWCPWELGFADGRKRADQIAIVPTRDSMGFIHGSEYLQLYRRIDIANGTLQWYQRGSLNGTSMLVLKT